MSKKKKSSIQTTPLSGIQMERLTRIQSFIENQTFVTAEQIGTELEVHPKTIYRAIELMIERFGHPIEYDQKTKRYWYTKKVAPIMPVLINEKEVTAFLMLKSIGDELRGTSYEEAFNTAFKKLSDSLADKMSLNFKDWQNAVSFHTSGETILDPNMFDTIVRSIVFREQMELVYKKVGADEKEKVRILDGDRLAKVDGNWYLFAYDHSCNKDRTFFVSNRIKSIRPTGKTYKRRKFCIKEKLKNAFGIRTGDRIYHVRLHFTPAAAEYIREKKWAAQEALHELGNGAVELCLKVSNLSEVQRFVMSWGGEGIVDQPAELEDMVISAARKIYERQEKRKAERGAAIAQASAVAQPVPSVQQAPPPPQAPGV